MLKRLKNEKGWSFAFSTCFLVIIIAFCLVFIIDVCSLMIAKLELDEACDQAVRCVQLNGKVDENMELIIDNTIGLNSKVESISYTVTPAEENGYVKNSDGCETAIQLGTAFTITLKAKVSLGGYLDMDGVSMYLTAQSVGVSEVYWKGATEVGD